MSFKALLLQERDGTVTCDVATLDKAKLPPGDVEVAVENSTLNYKDGLILTNKARLVRAFPQVPGIDFAGSVTESSNPNFREGDRVVLEAWVRLARDLPLDKLDAMTTMAELSDMPALAGKILKGQVRGRTVVAVREKACRRDARSLVENAAFSRAFDDLESTGEGAECHARS